MPRERLIHLTLRVVLAGFVVLKSGLGRGGQVRDRGGGPATRGRVDRGGSTSYVVVVRHCWTPETARVWAAGAQAVDSSRLGRPTPSFPAGA
ncbi:hypothetical protein HW130_02455 [Streptomyces sp. PKU-EA00015]|uniref:hypothetical protein n=1 Tax=Streptomyces sp. PKU-EA00015 TaxID=2748326 RepID=UPI0015A2516E|nr:hypothetical protein [Streptomyces sp. PKU-EA00015]NWF25131.1 hypothetical protein [Streptomyces sp. PKU-EA00015]